MTAYRKKPVVIEAIQFIGQPIEHLPYWCRGWVIASNDNSVKIRTLESNEFEAPRGAMLIRGVEGEVYACDEAIFRKTYDPVLPARRPFSAITETEIVCAVAACGIFAGFIIAFGFSALF